MPGSAATRTLQSHRYGDFAENGDDDSDEDEDTARPFAMVCLLQFGIPARKSLALHMADFDLKPLPCSACRVPYIKQTLCEHREPESSFHAPGDRK